jgi:hypothetical protein|tara:strand:+ start:718 stop:894 length:177 start_codon:yes stop_codon:yes gene_type:complete
MPDSLIIIALIAIVMALAWSLDAPHRRATRAAWREHKIRQRNRRAMIRENNNAWRNKR